MDTTMWRWFPQFLIGAMAVVFAVNGVMVYDALHTFPGSAGSDGFDLSNRYDRVLAASQQQASLGWQVEAEVSATRYPTLHLTGSDGKPLAGVTIEATAERPVGPQDTIPLTFRPVGDGRYQADTALFSGQWDIMLTIRTEGRPYRTTSRVVAQ